MLASTMSVAILAALNARPTMGEIMSWIDVETLLLLFSMMTLVAIIGETGVFDYLAVMAYKVRPLNKKVSKNFLKLYIVAYRWKDLAFDRNALLIYCIILVLLR